MVPDLRSLLGGPWRVASVTVEGRVVGEIGRGFLVLLGVGQGDGPDDARYVASKIAGLRVFDDDAGKMNRAVAEVGPDCAAWLATGKL